MKSRQSRNCRPQKLGFSILELVISVAIISFISATGIFILQSQLLGNLQSDAQIISDRLAEAQFRAIAGAGGNPWGIHFDNGSAPFYAMFQGSSYAAPSSTYYLSGLVAFQNPAANASTDIVFGKLSGTIATTTSIVIGLKTAPQQTKTITVNAKGQISVQ